VNNGTFLCSASTATTITLVNASGAAETHAATVAFQNNAQIGIQGGEIIAGTANVGTRPNGDVAYYVDSTPGDLSDWQHQSASIPGNILCVNHLSCVRKDDAGSRTYAPITVQGGSVVETGVTQGAASSYLYTADYLPSDPGTGVAWTQSGFNNSSFGIKEVA
jgi:hypothetical protein